jgi:hypothetical protein
MLTLSSNNQLAEKYYDAEKQDSFVVVAAGFAAIVLALFLLIGFGEDFYLGMAVGLVVLSAIYTSATLVVYLRTGRLRQEVTESIMGNPAAIQQQEMPRVQRSIDVLAQFQWGEAIALAIGVILLLYFWPRSEQHFWSGLGTAMAVQGLLLLAFHSVIIRRSKDYMQQLQNVVQGGEAGPSFDDKADADGW